MCNHKLHIFSINICIFVENMLKYSKILRGKMMAIKRKIDIECVNKNVDRTNIIQLIFLFYFFISFKVIIAEHENMFNSSNSYMVDSISKLLVGFQLHVETNLKFNEVKLDLDKKNFLKNSYFNAFGSDIFNKIITNHDVVNVELIGCILTLGCMIYLFKNISLILVSSCYNKSRKKNYRKFYLQ